MENNIDIHGPIREEDKENFHIAGKNFNVPLAIQDLYWQMDNIRQRAENATLEDKRKLLERVGDLGSVINTAKETANDEVRHFLGMVNDELTKTSLKLQMAIRKGKK